MEKWSVYAINRKGEPVYQQNFTSLAQAENFATRFNGGHVIDKDGKTVFTVDKK